MWTGFMCVCPRPGCGKNFLYKPKQFNPEITRERGEYTLWHRDNPKDPSRRYCLDYTGESPYRKFCESCLMRADEDDLTVDGTKEYLCNLCRSGEPIGSVKGIQAHLEQRHGEYTGPWREATVIAIRDIKRNPTWKTGPDLRFKIKHDSVRGRSIEAWAELFDVQSAGHVDTREQAGPSALDSSALPTGGESQDSFPAVAPLPIDEPFQAQSELEDFSLEPTISSDSMRPPSTQSSMLLSRELAPVPSPYERRPSQTSDPSSYRRQLGGPEPWSLKESSSSQEQLARSRTYTERQSDSPEVDEPEGSNRHRDKRR